MLAMQSMRHWRVASIHYRVTPAVSFGETAPAASAFGTSPKSTVRVTPVLFAP